MYETLATSILDRPLSGGGKGHFWQETTAGNLLRVTVRRDAHQ